MVYSGIKFIICQWCERELPEFDFKTAKRTRKVCHSCFTELRKLKNYNELKQDIEYLMKKFEWENWKNKRLVNSHKRRTDG